MHVILPQAPRNEIGRARKYPTLWLLHGRSDDHSMWTRQTSIERYADEAGIAVVMPAVGLSWYQDMAFGLNYGAFLREELPEIARSFSRFRHTAKTTSSRGSRWVAMARS